MSSFIEDTQISIHGGWWNSRSEDDDIERMLFPNVVGGSGEFSKRVDNLGPIENLCIGSGCVVASQALHSYEGLGQELVGSIQGTKIQKMRFFCIRRYDKKIIVLRNSGLRFWESDFVTERQKVSKCAAC